MRCVLKVKALSRQRGMRARLLGCVYAWMVLVISYGHVMSCVRATHASPFVRLRVRVACASIYHMKTEGGRNLLRTKKKARASNQIRSDYIK